MHRILKNKTKQGGFTLIELMIVVAIIGILAAVAIPQFLKMMAKSKAGEAELSLDLIKKSQKADWAEASGFHVGDGDALPSDGDVTTGCCDGTGGTRKCATDLAEWAGDEVWAALDFRTDQPGYFVYTYTGTAEEFTAQAIGDLDCDTNLAVYELTGSRVDGDPLFNLRKPAKSGVGDGVLTTDAD